MTRFRATPPPDVPDVLTESGIGGDVHALARFLDGLAQLGRDCPAPSGPLLAALQPRRASRRSMLVAAVVAVSLAASGAAAETRLHEPGVPAGPARSAAQTAAPAAVPGHRMMSSPARTPTVAARTARPLPAVSPAIPTPPALPSGSPQGSSEPERGGPTAALRSPAASDSGSPDEHSESPEPSDEPHRR
ncbi:MAG TPA: hypothetical protein VHO01_15280 [Jatrophihabitans sp.]|nr:hypothetical protein [Jatrophihabitans sp.]